MTDDKTKEQIVRFALNELKKTLDAVRQGKPASISPKLKKMFQTIKEGHDMMKEDKITENDMETVLNEAAKNASKTTDEK